jgi:hemerythrin superfamily protein
MDPTQILEADHREIEGLFDAIEGTSGEERVPHVKRLLTLLRAHMTLEEEVVYPSIKRVTGADSEVENKNEHSVARANLDEAESFLDGEPGLGAAMAAAQAAVSHHVQEEEADVFPEAREKGRELLEQMFPRFVQRRLELGMRVDGDALAAALTTDQLREHAQRLGVAHASTEHGELADRIAAQLSA